jgi:hypothetical protein
VEVRSRRHLHVHRPAKRQAWLADADIVGSM